MQVPARPTSVKTVPSLNDTEGMPCYISTILMPRHLPAGDIARRDLNLMDEHPMRCVYRGRLAQYLPRGASHS